MNGFRLVCLISFIASFSYSSYAGDKWRSMQEELEERKRYWSQHECFKEEKFVHFDGLQTLVAKTDATEEQPKPGTKRKNNQEDSRKGKRLRRSSSAEAKVSEENADSNETDREDLLSQLRVLRILNSVQVQQANKDAEEIRILEKQINNHQRLNKRCRALDQAKKDLAEQRRDLEIRIADLINQILEEQRLRCKSERETQALAILFDCEKEKSRLLEKQVSELTATCDTRQEELSSILTSLQASKEKVLGLRSKLNRHDEALLESNNLCKKLQAKNTRLEKENELLREANASGRQIEEGECLDEDASIAGSTSPDDQEKDNQD